MKDTPDRENVMGPHEQASRTDVMRISCVKLVIRQQANLNFQVLTVLKTAIVVIYI